MSVNPGLGTLLAHGIATVYTTIAQRVSIEGPDWKVGEADITVLSDTVKKFRPTIAESGEVDLKIYYDPAAATHSLLTGFMLAPTSEQWRITFADSVPSKYTFTGFLTGFKPTGMTVEGNLEADVKIRIDGLITVATT